MKRLIMFALCLACVFFSHRYFVSWESVTLFQVLLAAGVPLFLWLAVRK